jgi:hypothetical protein
MRGIKLAGFLVAAAMLAAAQTAEAACSYEGQSYPTGAVLCIGGKLYSCQSNDAWKVDRTSTCGT